MNEDYTVRAAELLRRKRDLQVAAEALREQIRFLEERQVSCRTSNFETASVSRNGFCDAEDRAIRLIEQLDDCRYRLRLLEEELEQIRRAYEVLSPYQRDLLDTFFVNGGKNCAEQLSARYYKERSALYRDRKKALYTFTLAAFGIMPY